MRCIEVLKGTFDLKKFRGESEIGESVQGTGSSANVEFTDWR